MVPRFESHRRNYSFPFTDNFRKAVPYIRELFPLQHKKCRNVAQPALPGERSVPPNGVHLFKPPSRKTSWKFSSRFAFGEGRDGILSDYWESNVSICQRIILPSFSFNNNKKSLNSCWFCSGKPAHVTNESRWNAVVWHSWKVNSQVLKNLGKTRNLIVKGESVSIEAATRLQEKLVCKQERTFSNVKVA